MGNSLEELADVYRDLHAHPELAFNEHRTAGIVAEHLRATPAGTTCTRRRCSA